MCDAGQSQPSRGIVDLVGVRLFAEGPPATGWAGSHLHLGRGCEQ